MKKKAPKFPDAKYVTRAVATLIREIDSIQYDQACDKNRATAGLKLVKGKLTLVVGKAYCDSPDEVKAEILKHHAGHFFLGHAGRREERQQHPWDLVTDASLHFNMVCDPGIIDDSVRAVPGFESFKSCTFDDLMGGNGRPIPPTTPEIAYTLLLQQPGKNGPGNTPSNNKSDDKDQESSGQANGEPQQPPEGNSDPNQDKQPGDGEGQKDNQPSGCGGSSVSEDDGSVESERKWAKVSVNMMNKDPEFRQAMEHITQSNYGGDESGVGRITPERVPPPKWIRQVITYLIRSRNTSHRSRSYRRENRAFPDLPGYPATESRSGLFLIDASGSISEEMIAQFFAAVTSTPELRDSQVVVFDTSWSEYIPVKDGNRILEAIRERGGGTYIRATGEAVRKPNMPAVWLTDAYTGDGWPEPHESAEVWLVWGDAGDPPNGITIRAHN